MTPILFLDVDGVLNTRSTVPGAGVRQVTVHVPYSSRQLTGVIIEERLKAVLDLVERCGARIVVSSSWRTAFDSAAAFASAIGVSPMADLNDIFHRDWRTGFKFSSQRAQEIGWWLAEHKAKRYAVLDDHDVFMRWPEREAHLVRTDADHAVTDADLRRVAALLSPAARGARQ